MCTQEIPFWKEKKIYKRQTNEKKIMFVDSTDCDFGWTTNIVTARQHDDGTITRSNKLAVG